MEKKRQKISTFSEIRSTKYNTNINNDSKFSQNEKPNHIKLLSQTHEKDTNINYQKTIGYCDFVKSIYDGHKKVNENNFHVLNCNNLQRQKMNDNNGDTKKLLKRKHSVKIDIKKNGNRRVWKEDNFLFKVFKGSPLRWQKIINEYNFFSSCDKILDSVIKYHGVKGFIVKNPNNMNEVHLLQKYDYIHGFDLLKRNLFNQYLSNEIWVNDWLKKSDTICENLFSSIQNFQTTQIIYDGEELLEKNSFFETNSFFTSLALQLCLTTKLMWNMGWSHGDIKPNNLMINPNEKKIYWIDFELCLNFRNENYLFEPFRGSTIWSPPFLLFDYKLSYILWNEFHCKLKDLWSLLATIYYLFSGKILISQDQDGSYDYTKKMTNFDFDWKKLVIIETGSNYFDNLFHYWFICIYDNYNKHKLFNLNTKQKTDTNSEEKSNQSASKIFDQILDQMISLFNQNLKK